MSYTRMDRLMDEAALGFSFSRRTRVLTWVLKRTHPLWTRPPWLYAAVLRTMAWTLVPARARSRRG